MSGKLTYLLSFILIIGLIGGVANAQPLRQDTGPDGIVCVEAENFDDNIPDGVHEWIFNTEPIGYTGTGFIIYAYT